MYQAPSRRGMRRTTARLTIAAALTVASAVVVTLPARAGPANASGPAALTGPAAAANPAQVSDIRAGRNPIEAAGPAVAPVARRPLIARHPASIPDAAMLRPEDLGSAGTTPVTDDYWSRLRPPQPCGDGPAPSAGLLRTDRAITALVGVGEAPTVILEHVAIYRSDGAHRYLTELRRALRTCGSTDEHDPRWTLLATGLAGDESMLLSLREYADYADMYKNTYVMVARIGRVLVVLADNGWETSSGHEALVRELSAVAVRRAAILNR